MNSSDKRPLTPGQRKALEAIPNLKDSVFPQVRATLQASRYTDPARFDLEKEKLFRRRPLIAGPSALIPNPSSYFQQTLLGMPVLVTRSKEGEIRAFVNVCRHRGAILYPGKEPAEGLRIVCPYHAWTFRFDGSLFAIPRQETFPGINKDDISLTPLPVVEAGGFIWVGIEPGYDTDFSSVQGELEQDLDALGLGAMTIFDKTTFEIKANWKLVMDTMLDSYHVTRLHKDTLARFFVDAQNIIDPIPDGGPHVRVAAARGNFERSIACEGFEDARQIMVFHYTLFPNAIVVVSPDFISVGILRPIATDRTDVDYFMLINQPPADEKMQNKLRRSFDLMGAAFGREDYWAAELCDAGLRAGTMNEVQLGGMEVQMTLFHNTIDQCLGDAR